ncbi:MAG: T9SS type A sorting domain-containing protein [Bacteroidota bacterium]
MKTAYFYNRLLSRFFGLAILLAYSTSTVHAIDIQVVNEVTCTGENAGMNGKLRITGIASHPVPIMNIQWSNGESGPGKTEIDMLMPGTYTVVVTDQGGCTASAMKQLISDAQVSIEGGGERAVCPEDEQKAKLTAVISGGCLGCTYSWSNGGSGPSITVTTNGSYSVTVTTAGGACMETDQTTVTFVPQTDCDDPDFEIPIPHAVDPNDITGPPGYDSTRWVSVNDRLEYKVRYENDPVFATAPAQVVKIDVPIDDDLNPFSFRVGNLGFGSFTVDVPQDQTFFTTQVDAVDSLGVLVNITAGVDITENKYFWIFESIDPVTGLPPDPLLGFLPVNDTIDRLADTLASPGEGYVTFSAIPKSNSITGDTIFAQASIIFDVNDPLLTNIEFNTIDADNPVSSMIPTFLTTDSSAFDLSWMGSDIGSGVAGYALWVSQNNGPYELWTDTLTGNSVTFQGINGTTYDFYTIATDNVGNIEDDKDTPEESIVVDGVLEIENPIGGEIFCAYDTIPIAWNSEGIQLVDLSYSTDGGVNFELFADSLDASTGTYNWPIPPEIPDGDFLIQIITTGGFIADTSDATFGIHPIIINLGDDFEVCREENVTLGGAPATGGFGNLTFSWTSDEGFTANTANPSHAPQFSDRYYLTISDEAGCISRDTVEGIVNRLPAISISKTHVTCAGSPEGSIELTLASGTPPYDGLWNDGNSDLIRNNLVADTYTVSVTDDKGCQKVQDILIFDLNPFTLDAGDDFVLCVGDTVALGGAPTLLGGAPPHSIQWFPATGLDDASITNPNTFTDVDRQYVLTVMDSLNCIFLDTINVTVRDKPVINPVVTEILCGDEAEGAIDLAISSGEMPFNISWNDGSNLENRTDLADGYYAATVTDANSCLATSEFLLEEPAPYVISAGDDKNICFGDSVTLGVGVDAAIINMVNFQWTPNYNMDDDQVLTPIVNPEVDTMYILTTVDTIGCMKTDSVLVNLNDGVTVDASISQPSCNTGDDGVIALTISAGTPPYNVIWSDGSTDANRSGLTPGTYAVTVTDSSPGANPCEFETSYLLEEAADLVVNFGPDPAICEGESVVLNGMVTNLNATYNWSPALSLDFTDIANPTATPLTNTQYYVTVTDLVGGCIVEDSVMVTINPLPIIDAGLDQTICADESAMLQAMGGLTYMWSPSEGLDQTDIANPTANPSDTTTYIVIGTDANNCSSSANVTVNVNSLPTLSIDGLQSDYCANDGLVTLAGTPIGGSFTLDGNGVMSFDPSMLSLGMHTIEYAYTDVNNCSNTISQNINILSFPNIELGNDTTIFVGESVILDATIPGGIYEWSDITDGATLTVTQSGTYSVTVTNANNCVAIDMIVVNVNSNIALNAMEDNPVICNGEANGQATITANGGVAPYTYLWDNGETSATATMLSGGSHSFTVVDSEGFNAMGSVIINEPQALTAMATANQNVLCNGEMTGQATAMPMGGTGNYTFTWDNGETTQTATLLDAGQHVVSITDANGCITQASVSITEPVVLNLTTTEDQSVTCFGNGDGFATAFPTGGTIPYTFLWDNGLTDQSIGNLSGGTYVVTLTDANGCTTTSSVTIQESGSTLVANAVLESLVLCNGESNGQATASASGGTAGYTFLWDNGETTATAVALNAGDHTVSITDAFGCLATKTINITEPVALSSTVSEDLAVACNGESNGQATIIPSGGTMPYTYLWDNGETNQTAIMLDAGDHTVSLTDANGCLTEGMVTIAEPELIIASATADADVLCNGSSNGIATASSTGGTGAYTFLWDNGETDAMAVMLDAGDHTVTITDGNGCLSAASITINEPDQLVIMAEEDQSVLCNGESNGQATVSLTGGTAPFTYAWDNGETDPTATGLNSGLHAVTVVDINGCTENTTVEITAPETLIASIVSTDDTGSGNGTAAVIPFGGTPPYSYEWDTDPVQTDSLITGLDAGLYTATLTDANGCTVVESVEVFLLIGVDNLAEVSSFDIFPNPVQDILNIDIKLHDLHNVRTEIYDDTGRLIEEVADEGLLERLYQLDVGGYAAGVYLVKLTIEGKVVGEQFVVIKR